jgi:NADPH:quinone reductase-like Zn-dependent oxidoreductase
MKAAVLDRYGPPEAVRITEVPDPTPGPHEVLVRIRASTVSAADWRIRSLAMPRGFGWLARPVFGLRRPRRPILGTELAGDIIAVGSAVTRWQVGDRVFAFPGAGVSCHAELRTLREDAAMAPMPRGASYEEAAAMSFGGATAWHFLKRLADVQRGQRVLVIGASGSVGSAAIQVARALGAHVTAVCSTMHIDAVRNLGADAFIDYRTTSWTMAGATWDIILDTAGIASRPLAAPHLAPKGKLLLAAATLGQMAGAPFGNLFASGGRRVIVGTAPERTEDLLALKDLYESGAYRPLIGQTFPLEAIVEAHRSADGGHKRGNTVVTIP